MIAKVPNPSVNRSACKLRLQVCSGLRPPPVGYVERWASRLASKEPA